ncbi:MAG: hypothetical protein ACR2PG_26635 [Hyphomicrobiaceae bacterium]
MRECCIPAVIVSLLASLVAALLFSALAQAETPFAKVKRVGAAILCNSKEDAKRIYDLQKKLAADSIKNSQVILRAEKIVKYETMLTTKDFDCVPLVFRRLVQKLSIESRAIFLLPSYRGEVLAFRDKSGFYEQLTIPSLVTLDNVSALGSFELTILEAELKSGEIRYAVGGFGRLAFANETRSNRSNWKALAKAKKLSYGARRRGSRR